MKQIMQIIGDRNWIGGRTQILKRLFGDITLVKQGNSYFILKWLLGVCRYENGSLRYLGSLGLFVIPSLAVDEDEESYDVGEKEHWYPFKQIPDVKRFEVELNAFDPIFAMFGIRKRFAPKITFDKYENRRFNRYMDFQLKRLEDARVGKFKTESDYNSYEEFIESTYERSYVVKPKGSKIGYRVTSRFSKPNPILYFRIVTSLLKYSRVFFVRQLMLTEPKGHRNIPYHQIGKGWHAHRKIAKEAARIYDDKVGGAAPKINYRRVFIPKPNGELRPLGVPTYPGRIYLAQWNKFLLKLTQGKINEHQHAYQPYKGVDTAGRDIMENIIDKRNIYSYDLNKYFDKIILSEAIKSLEMLGVPKSICSCLSSMHKSLPANNTIIYKQKYIDYALKSVGHEEEGFEPPQRGVGVGIPQGGGVSPLLAIILQESELFPKIKAQGAEVVKFADDGLIASNDDQGVPDVTVLNQGIVESKKKSFGVKKEGIGLKPLDFCGLRYDGENDKIIANTRSGSRLELKDVDGLVPLLSYRDLIPLNDNDPSSEPGKSEYFETIKYKGSSPRDIIKNKVGGLLQSRLFTGSGELIDYKQDFRLTAKKGSLVSMHYKHLKLNGVNVFTSTSGAFPVIIKDLGESRRKYQKRGRLKRLNL